MDRETQEILTDIQKSRLAEKKREDRAVKFRAEEEALFAQSRRDLEEIKKAAKECDPLVDYCDRLGMRAYSNVRPWLENYELLRAKIYSIPDALLWVSLLTEQNFAERFSNNYPWVEQKLSFIHEYVFNKSGSGNGAARSMFHYHSLLESWIKQNKDELVKLERLATVH